MNSLFLRLNVKDFAKGLIVAVLVVAIGAIQQALTQHGLDVGAYNWVGIMDLAWKAGSAYLVKNLLSTEDGRVLGAV